MARNRRTSTRGWSSHEPLEADVKRDLKAILEAEGAYYFMAVPSGMGTNTVDFLACVPVVVVPEMVGMRLGIFTAIETKRPSVYKPTGAQELVLKAVREAGGLAGLINGTGPLTRVQFEDIMGGGCGTGSYEIEGQRKDGLHTRRTKGTRR